MTSEEKKSICDTLIELIESLDEIDERVYGKEFKAGAILRETQIEMLIIDTLKGD